MSYDNVGDVPVSELTHYGVKGMRWGIRRGKGTTGVSRTRGAMLDRNARMRKQITQVQSGEKYRAFAAAGKALYGKKRWDKKLNKTLSSLDKQDQRLMSKGRMTLRDRLDASYNIPVSDLFVSVRPRD